MPGIRFFLNLVLVVLLSFELQAQDTIIYWPGSCEATVHSRIVDAHTVDNELYLLSRSSDFDFRNPKADLSKMDLLTFKRKSGCIEIDSLHELSGISISADELRIYASVQNDGRLSPFVSSCDLNTLVEVSSKSTLVEKPDLTEVVTDFKKISLVGFSTLQRSGVFNARLEWLNKKKDYALTQEQVLRSPFNEELSAIDISSKGEIAILCKRFKNPDYSEYSSALYLLDKKGNLKWSVELSDKMSFSTHCMGFNSKGQIVYAAGKNQKEIALGYTIVSVLGEDGKVLQSAKIKDFIARGFLLHGQSLLAYGSSTKWISPFIIQKAKFLVIDEDLQQGNARMLDHTNRPDNEMPAELRLKLPSSSEYLGAQSLDDGRILLFGRLFFNTADNLEEAVKVPRRNYNLVSIYQL